MRPAGYSVLWGTAFAFAVTTGIVSVSLVRADDGRLGTLTAGEIRQRLNAPVPPAQPAQPALPGTPDGFPATSPRPIGGPKETAGKEAKKKSPSPRPSTGGQPRGLSSSAGSVTASCRGDEAFLLSWSAAPGFRIENVERGPAPQVGVRFDKFFDFGSPDVILLVTCENDVPKGRQLLDGGNGKDDDDDGDDDGPGRGRD